MGPRAQKALADSNDAQLDALGHILTEMRAQRATLARVCARLGIEIEDREAGDKGLGRQVVEQEREIQRLKLVTHSGAE